MYIDCSGGVAGGAAAAAVASWGMAGLADAMLGLSSGGGMVGEGSAGTGGRGVGGNGGVTSISYQDPMRVFNTVPCPASIGRLRDRCIWHGKPSTYLGKSLMHLALASHRCI